MSKHSLLFLSLKHKSQLLYGVVICLAVTLLSFLLLFSNTIQAQTQIINGGTTVSASVADTLPPYEFELKRPHDDSYVTSTSPSFVWEEATDNLEMSHYQLYIDGQLIFDNIPLTSDSNNDYTLTYNVASQEYELNPDGLDLSEGEHEWHVRAVDTVDLSTATEKWQFIVDSEEPNLRIDKVDTTDTQISTTDPSSVPTQAIFLDNNEPTLLGVGEINSSVVLKVDYESKDDEFFSFSIDNTGSWNIALDTLPRDETILLTFTVTDQAGLTSVLSNVPIFLEPIQIVIPLPTVPPPTPTPTPSTPPLGFVQPGDISIEIEPGESLPALIVTSQGSTSFALVGPPTSYGSGIDWQPISGSINPGSNSTVSLSVDSSVPEGIYTGVATLQDPDNTTYSYTFTVQVSVIEKRTSGFVPPGEVSVKLAAGTREPAFTLTSTGSTDFEFIGSPTSYGKGIDWQPISGVIFENGSKTINILAGDDIEPGIYTGIGVLRDPENPNLEYSFPVTVEIIRAIVIDLPDPNIPGQTLQDGIDTTLEGFAALTQFEDANIKPLSAKRPVKLSAFSAAIPILSILALQLAMLTSHMSHALSPKMIMEFSTLIEIGRLVGIIPKDNPYGMVFESITQDPAQYAAVVFTGTTSQGRHYKKVKITDKHGIFGKPNLPDGKYRAAVEFDKHLFPTMIQRSKKTPWQNFYRGEEFEVKDSREPSLFIPIDLNSDARDAEFWQNALRSSETKILHINPLSAKMLILNTTLSILFPSPFNAIIFLLHVSHLAYKSLSKKIPRLTGRVINPQNKPLEKVAIKLFKSGSEDLHSLGQTDDTGNFAFVVNKGDYTLSLHLHEYLPKGKQSKDGIAEDLDFKIAEEPVYETIIMKKDRHAHVVKLKS